jgi:hypothetical protein
MKAFVFAQTKPSAILTIVSAKTSVSTASDAFKMVAQFTPPIPLFLSELCRYWDRQVHFWSRDVGHRYMNDRIDLD